MRIVRKVGVGKQNSQLRIERGKFFVLEGGCGRMDEDRRDWYPWERGIICVGNMISLILFKSITS